jgi:hypothetical protein
MSADEIQQALFEKTKTYDLGELELVPNESHEFDFYFLLAEETRIVKVLHISQIFANLSGALVGWHPQFIL